MSNRQLPKPTRLCIVANVLVGEINKATPAQLREAARVLDDTANDPALKRYDRKLYFALSDIMKLALK